MTVKIHPNFVNNGCFMQNFMELNMKKIFDPKTVAFGFWGLETIFWQFGP